MPLPLPLPLPVPLPFFRPLLWPPTVWLVEWKLHLPEFQLGFALLLEYLAPSLPSLRFESKEGEKIIILLVLRNDGWRVDKSPNPICGRRALSLCFAAKPEPLKSCTIWHNLHPICKPTGSTHPSSRRVVHMLHAAVCPFGLSRHHSQPQSQFRSLAFRRALCGQNWRQRFVKSSSLGTAVLLWRFQVQSYYLPAIYTTPGQLQSPNIGMGRKEWTWSNVVAGIPIASTTCTQRALPRPCWVV